MTTLIYAYPWDIAADPSAPERFAELAAAGVDGVALAASYHTTRAATPFHPDHRLVDARHAATYIPVRQEVWAGHRLVPGVPDWTVTDSFGVAAEVLRSIGLTVHAWVALTHNSRLGAANPDLVVHNAFGDRYPYALCPSAEAVGTYCETLVREVVALGRPDGVVLEACGPLGFVHGGHHDKTDGADWSSVQKALLSLCFCASCLERYESAGIRPDGLRAKVRAAVDGDTDVDTGEPPGSVDAALGEFGQPVREIRTSLAAGLRTRLIHAIREAEPMTRVALHASADPWATGPFATVAGAPLDPADVQGLVAGCWGPPEVAVANLEALRALAPPDVEIGAYVQALPPTPATSEALLTAIHRFEKAGARELHLYHGGLASKARLAAIRKAISSL